MRVRVGTSGFSYSEWKGLFYPERIRGEAMLAFYADRLDTVEINNTFHRMPRVPVLEGWASRVPKDFSFALKVPRRISHKKNFEDVEPPLEVFTANLQTLGALLGPTLFQFPPYFRKDLRILARLIDAIPVGFRCAFEFRHASWFDGETIDALCAREIALVVSDRKTDDPSIVRTGPFGYLRLRREDYSDERLREWAAKLARSGWDEAYVFFKHEEDGAAPRMAARLREVLAC